MLDDSLIRILSYGQSAGCLQTSYKDHYWKGGYKVSLELAVMIGLANLTLIKYRPNIGYFRKVKIESLLKLYGSDVKLLAECFQ